ncbi:MAG: Sec-independent protein translocase protein TatB [Methylococcus sp.]
MFDVGFSELLLIGLVALLVFGPERLPKMVREISFWIRKIRGVMMSARSEIERELQLAELRESLQQQRQTVEKELDAMPVKPPSQWLPRPPGLEKSSPRVDDTDP